MKKLYICTAVSINENNHCDGHKKIYVLAEDYVGAQVVALKWMDDARLCYTNHISKIEIIGCQDGIESRIPLAIQ